MIIYLNNNPESFLDIQVDDDSYRYRAVMGEHALTLHFSLKQHREIPVGAWTEYEGARYELVQPGTIKKKSSRNFEYTLVMEAEQVKLKKYKFRNVADNRLEFSYTARPHEHLQLLVDNMNLRETGWQTGECIDAAEKVISYNHTFCMDALGQIAGEFNTEYEIVGKTIHLRKVAYNKENPLPLSYGKGNGFKPGVGRSNLGDSRSADVLFVQGGEENIDPGKYGSAKLLLPKGATLNYDGAQFGAGTAYFTDFDGLSIRRGDGPAQGGNEDSLDCSHISPKRVGTISGVEVVDAEKNFYDIVDDSIPEDLDYGKCLIAGETMTIVFQSGMLAGKEFEVKYFHEAVGNKAARRFEIVPQNIDGQTMPNDTFKPAAGNTYAVFHIALPEAYVCNDEDKTGASWDMFREGVKYLYENKEPKFSFTGELDGLWAKKDWLNIGGRIKLGGFVLFSDKQFQPEGIPIRIVGIKDFINNPHSPEIELSNQTVGSSFSSQISKIEQAEVVIDDQYRKAIQFTKRRFRDSLETISMLKDALLDSYTDSISPLTVQTMTMLLGDESLQFRFVNSKTAPTQVEHRVDYDSQAKVLRVPGGIIQHMTLGMKDLSSSHKASEYKFWTLPAFDTPPLTDGAKTYYLYAKVSASNQTGAFHISETAIKMNAERECHYLLMGLLDSELDSERSYVSLYGFTEILPGQITTDRIVSPDGRTYFDIANGKIGGQISFVGTDGDYKDVTELDDAVKTVQEATAAVNKAVTDLDSYVDGAFRDGIISNVEAVAIEKYINTVNETMTSVTGTYNNVYNNTYLTGLAKTDLADKYILFSGFKDTLITAINMAIADHVTTVEEKQAVDMCYASFNTALANFNEAVEVANKSIQDRLKGYTDDLVAGIKVGGANLLSNSAEEKTSTYGYLYYANIAHIIDKYGIQEYTVSFDIKTSQPGSGQVYFNPGEDSSFRYFTTPALKMIDTTTEYTRHHIVVTPRVNTLTSNSTPLAFFFGWGSEIIPTVKNVKVETGNKPTDWSPAPEDVQQKIDGLNDLVAGIKVGGVNLLLGTRSGEGWNYTRLNDGVFELDNNSSGAVYIINNIRTIKKDQEYTLSFQYKTSPNSVSPRAWIYETTNTTIQTGLELELTNDWKEVTATFTANKDSDSCIVRFDNNGRTDSNTSILYIRQPKLEHGNKATDWTPAPEDVDKKIDDIQVGGVNLITNSKLIQYVANSVGNQVVPGYKSGTLKAGQTYIASCRGKSEHAADTILLYPEATIVAYNKPFTPINDVELLFVRGSYNTNCEVYYLKVEKGNKATDWTPAPEDLQAEIDAAQAAADAAVAKLTDWASDSTISPTEKTALKQQQQDIQSEYAEILTNAGRYSVSTTSYTAAYTAALVAFAKYTAAAPESIPIEADYANISAYYAARQTILEQIATAVKTYTDSLTDNRRESVIDATALDQNTYYPVTLMLTGQTHKSNIEVWADFNVDSGTPTWSVHPSKSFSCCCKWSAFGSGWGSRHVERIFDNYQYRWTVDDIPPIGSVDQMGFSSNEYIYVRGGAKYHFRYTLADDPVLHVEDFSVNDQTISPKTSVEKPSTLQNIAAEAQSAIAAMNDDGVFDISEKQSIRTQWEHISGISNTVDNPTTAAGGSYIRTLDTATKLSVPVASLTAAFNALRAYLNALELYTNTNRFGFSRSEMAAQFTAYYDAETDLLTLIAKRQAVLQGAQDKDAIAKDLGYTDYAEMEREAKAGKTIIEGGKIRTELLEASQIVAMGVDVVNGNARVKITPDEGMTLLENNKVTAKFTGQQIESVFDNIPVNSNVLITEQKNRFPDVPDIGTTTLTLASGTISGTSLVPVTIEIPPIRIYAQLKLLSSKWTPWTTMWVDYLINGVVQASFIFEIEHFHAYEINVGQDHEGYPIYETRYRGDVDHEITTPAFSITANTSNKPVLVQVRYHFNAQPDPEDYWDNKLYAQFLSSALEAAPVSKYLDVGGLSFNSTFYGNGLIFSKNTNQIVGMCATSEGTELIARAGNHGLKVDQTGVSHLKSDGSSWDNSGLLCGYHVDVNVNVNGGFLTRFGIKDKSVNKCVLQTNPGRYRLTHNIGHTDYVVSMVVALAGWEYTNIAVKSENYVDVEIHDGAGKFANRPFMILLFGRP